MFAGCTRITGFHDPSTGELTEQQAYRASRQSPTPGRRVQPVGQIGRPRWDTVGGRHVEPGFDHPGELAVDRLGAWPHGRGTPGHFCTAPVAPTLVGCCASVELGAQVAARARGQVRTGADNGPGGCHDARMTADRGNAPDTDPQSALAVERALDFLTENHHAVLVTHRSGGGLQSSPVAAGVDDDRRIVVSTPSRTAKARNLRQDPRATLCVVTDEWFGPWVHVDAAAEVVTQPDALPLLEDYYRRLAGDHPDWEDYRRVMVTEDRVLLRLTAQHAAGPDLTR